MNIAFVGLYGVPELNRACDVRLSFFANMLSESNHVMVLNRYASKKSLKKGNVKLNDSVETCELIKPKSTGPVLSAVLLVLSVLIEPFVLLKKNKKQHIGIVHVYSGHYYDFFHYWWISRLIKAKVVYQYVEYKSVIKTRNPYHVVNNWLCDHKGAKLWDGLISISDFLERKALDVNPKLITTKVTPLCDFQVFQTEEKTVRTKPFIMYCGSFGYKEVVDFIVESYEKSLISNSHDLVMVLSGKKFELEQYQKQHEKLVVLSNLSYGDLIAHYKQASALLIPLRSTIKDVARFPNKICEYLASNNIIVTTNCGEIPNYFIDGYNAIVAEKYDVELFKEKLDDLSCGKYDIESIKANAYNTGLKYFDASSYKRTIQDFLETVQTTK